jgi:hypothetical protein
LLSEDPPEHGQELQARIARLRQQALRALKHVHRCCDVGAFVCALGGVRQMFRARRSGEILVSETVKDIVAGSALRFEDRGQHELKGIEGRRRLYAVAPD